MPHINIHFADQDATAAWPDLPAKEEAGQVEYVERLSVSVYPEATQSGAPSACFRFDLKDGAVIIAQVTIRNMIALQAAIKGRLDFLGIDENGAPTRPPRTDAN